MAASSGKQDLVKWLLERGASVHVRDTNNETPLLAAVKAGHLPIVRVRIVEDIIEINTSPTPDPVPVWSPPWPDTW